MRSNDDDKPGNPSITLSRRSLFGVTTAGLSLACVSPKTTTQPDAAPPPGPTPTPEPVAMAAEHHGMSPMLEDIVPIVEPAQLKDKAADGLEAASGGPPLVQIPEFVAKDGRLYVKFDIRETMVPVGYNEVSLRSYVYDHPSAIRGPFGPTIRMKPGATELTVDIQNSLPFEAPPPHPHDHNKPWAANTTNLHFHGFHGSPYEDDIFRHVEPSFGSRYSYSLAGHPGGTHWYHPHVHGTTAIQVASGMSGALIIEGDVEAFFSKKGFKIAEQVLVINQIAYDASLTPKRIPWSADRPVDAFNYITNFQINRFPSGTTVNGQINPTIGMKRNEVQRWRIINSGFAGALRFLIPRGFEAWLLAVDGINTRRLTKIDEKIGVAMGPGNRVDLLVRAPNQTMALPLRVANYHSLLEYHHLLPREGKDYVDNHLLNFLGPPSGVLATVASDGVVTERQPNPADLELPELPEQWKDVVVPSGATERRVEFNMPRNNGVTSFVINGEPFNGRDIPFVLPGGGSERWQLSNKVGMHPYHIHVNPFQVTHVGQYELTRPQWRDSILIPTVPAQGTPEPTCRPTATIVSRYDARYPGDFVLHCHILHHEDQGMMARVRVEPPK